MSSRRDEIHTIIVARQEEQKRYNKAIRDIQNQEAIETAPYRLLCHDLLMSHDPRHKWISSQEMYKRFCYPAQERAKKAIEELNKERGLVKRVTEEPQ